MKKSNLIILFLAISLNCLSQYKTDFGISDNIDKTEVNFNCGLVSQYIYRAHNYGGLSLQPSINFKLGHFTFNNWFSFGFKDYTFQQFNPEYDLIITYKNGPLLLGSKYVNTFKDAGSLNVNIGLDALYFTNNQSLIIKWDTKIYGKDYIPGTLIRAYTSYFVVDYMYLFENGFYIVTNLGFTPWSGFYNDYKGGFSMVDFTIQAHKIYCYNGMLFVPYVSFSLNPYDINNYNFLTRAKYTYGLQRMNFVIGCNMKINLYKNN